MISELDNLHRDEQLSIRDFVQDKINPLASSIDQNQKVPNQIIQLLASKGYLGYPIRSNFDGLDKDMISFGLLNEEIGRACSSLRSLITVHSMISFVIQKWGNIKQQKYYLPKLARGEIIGAFALTEPENGSDVQNIQSSLSEKKDSFILNGKKKWITFGQIADVFLVFGKFEGKISALLVDKKTPGLSLKPIRALLGVRGSMLAELTFQDCNISKKNLLGGIGLGLNPIALGGLNIGRYSIAWGCLGMAKACFEASVKYSNSRKQFDKYINKHQLIQGMLADMMVEIRAASWLCFHSGKLMDSNDPSCFKELIMAKYYTTVMASKLAKNAVQIHGANGCSDEYPVERFYRDSQIMEIIEGSNQMMQIMLSKYDLHEINNY